MMARNENKNAEKPTLVSSNDPRKMCADSRRVQLGSNHPLGMTLSENILEEISIRHELSSAPDVTDNANAIEIGLGKINLEDDYDPTMMGRNENKKAENLPWFQAMTLERCVPIQEGYNQAVTIRQE